MIQSHRHARTDSPIPDRTILHAGENAPTFHDRLVFRLIMRQGAPAVSLGIEVINRGRHSRIANMSGEGCADPGTLPFEPAQKIVADMREVEFVRVEIRAKENHKIPAKHLFARSDIVEV